MAIELEDLFMGYIEGCNKELRGNYSGWIIREKDYWPMGVAVPMTVIKKGCFVELEECLIN